MASEIMVPVTVNVTWKTVEESEDLQNLLRVLIREELANLSPESVQVLTDQIVRQYEEK
jgi:hypothetical protein